MMRLLICVVLLGGVTCASSLAAHEMRPAFLELEQRDADTFDVLWKVPARGDLRLALYVRFPEGTNEVGDRTAYRVGAAYFEKWTIQRTGGLVDQTVTIDGLNATMTDVLVRLEWSSGRSQTVRLDPAQPSFVVEAEPSWTQLIAAYTWMGIEHILLGVDHLLFVVGLMLIVRGTRSLIKTITAFTVAHSITLALAVCGVVNVPAAPVDAAIALSIVFLGVEIIRDRRGNQGLTVRFPWLVAFAFGLLHGLGFAGALTELGLPAADIPLALLFFNVGVEIGQLLFVLFFQALHWAFHTLAVKWPKWSLWVPAYVIGSLAMSWFIGRFLVMFPVLA